MWFIFGEKNVGSFGDVIGVFFRVFTYTYTTDKMRDTLYIKKTRLPTFYEDFYHNVN